VRIEIKEARIACLESARSVSECEKIVRQLEEKLDEKISEAEELALKKRELDLKEKDLQAKKESDVTYITVNQNKIIKRANREYYTRSHANNYEASLTLQGEQGTASLTISETSNNLVTPQGGHDEHNYEHPHGHRPPPIVIDRPLPLQPPPKKQAINEAVHP
jgi:hypothetical protein